LALRENELKAVISSKKFLNDWSNALLIARMVSNSEIG